MGGGMSEVVFADMREIISSEATDAGYEGVVELSLKIQSFMPNKDVLTVLSGIFAAMNGYNCLLMASRSARSFSSTRVTILLLCQ